MQKLKLHLFITISLYIISYLCYSFIVWELINPFRWIILIPTSSIDYRLFTLFFLSFYHIVLGVLISETAKDKKTNN